MLGSRVSGEALPTDMSRLASPKEKHNFPSCGDGWRRKNRGFPNETRTIVHVLDSGGAVTKGRGRSRCSEPRSLPHYDGGGGTE